MKADDKMSKDRNMTRIFDTSAEKESLDIEGDEFIAKYSKVFKIATSVAAILSTTTGLSIKLYDQNRKKLISFDSYTVGYKRILKLAKLSYINNI